MTMAAYTQEFGIKSLLRSSSECGGDGLRPLRL